VKICFEIPAHWKATFSINLNKVSVLLLEFNAAVSLLDSPRDVSSSEMSTLPMIQLAVLSLGQAQGPSLSLSYITTAGCCQRQTTGLDSPFV